MLKTRLKRFAQLLSLLSLLLFTKLGNAQETPVSKLLITYIQELEQQFDIKFSYVDEEIRPIELHVPKSGTLQELLADIEKQTQIKISKLSDRYYTLLKSTTVDICGSVFDNYEQNTIPGATVQVLDSEIAIITDLDGNFSLENIARKSVLQIQHLGFKPLFITAEELVNRAPCATLVLAQNVQQLDEVVVIELLTSGLVKQPDASIEMNTEAFGILPGSIEPDVLQTVQALPGIKSIDETVSDINIRGGTNDQNLILWDGIKMYQSGHFFGLISAFNPYLTDKVTIIKNGTSAAYGDGVSGVISMQTKNELTEKFFGGAGFNFISADGYGQFPLGEKLAIQFSARRSITDFLNTPAYDQFSVRAFQDSEVTRNSNFFFYDFTGKLLYDINDKHKLRLSFININNSLNYDETKPDANQNSQSALDQANLSVGASMQSTWSKTFATTLNGYSSAYQLDSKNSTVNGLQSLLQTNKVLERGLKLNTIYSPAKTLNWMNGYQFSETGILNFTEVTQPPFNSDILEVMRTHSFFSELGYTSKNNDFIARAGVRLNYFDNPNTFTEFIPEPRLNLNYALTDRLKVEFLGEFKSQATNQIVDLEQNFLGIEKRRWILSDGAQLPITKSKQGSLGLNYDHRDLYISLEGFYKEVNDISTETQGFQNQFQFGGEVGKYEVKGIEFLI
ncbi:MAG: carboxypeptidase-like regulatory domain-containing protein, partial [Flavobacteriaceae bacterium]